MKENLKKKSRFQRQYNMINRNRDGEEKRGGEEEKERDTANGNF